MVDIEDVVTRSKRLAGVAHNKELAKILGISDKDFSNRKKRGTLLRVIVEWAVNGKVDLCYLLEGSSVKQEFETTHILSELDTWLLEFKEDRERKVIWFEEEVFRHFPEFHEWLKKREEAAPVADSVKGARPPMP